MPHTGTPKEASNFKDLAEWRGMEASMERVASRYK
jgi:hypothetical protein